jgi:uncharacterized LabA/DUF88 family protein
MVSRHAQENKETAPGNPGAVGPGLLTLAGCLQRTPRTPFKLWRSAVNRVAVYVDGFNLYYGLRTRHGRQHLWLDLQALAASLLRPGQVLQRVTYFTARVRDNPDALQRQADYLDALSSHSPLVHIVDGRFQEKDRRCQSCGHQWTVFEEKETDVNIAISLVEDAVRDRYDTAILLSGDSDLIPAIKAAKRLAAPKRVIVAFPPNRHSAELKLVADGFLHVGINKVRNSQLPEQVVNRAGVTLSRPKHWT